MHLGPAPERSDGSWGEEHGDSRRDSLLSQKDCSTSLKEEWALQISAFHICPHHIAVLAGYTLVIGFFLVEATSALLREVVATFTALSLAARPPLCAHWLKLSQDISLLLCHIIIRGFKHGSIMLTTHLF